MSTKGQLIRLTFTSFLAQLDTGYLVFYHDQVNIDNGFLTVYVFCRYLTALRVRHATDVADCDTACVHVHYCAITRADYHEFRACVRNPASALASRAAHNSAAILLYAILILLRS